MIFPANHLIYHSMGLAMALAGRSLEWTSHLVPLAVRCPICRCWAARWFNLLIMMCWSRGLAFHGVFVSVCIYIYISDQQMGKISRWCPSPYFNWSNFYGWFPSALDLPGFGWISWRDTVKAGPGGLWPVMGDMEVTTWGKGRCGTLSHTTIIWIVIVV